MNRSTFAGIAILKTFFGVRRMEIPIENLAIGANQAVISDGNLLLRLDGHTGHAGVPTDG